MNWATLGAAFNTMAARIQQQAAELQRESADQYRKLFQTMTEAFCTIEMIFDAGRTTGRLRVPGNQPGVRGAGRDCATWSASGADEVVPELPASTGCRCTAASRRPASRWTSNEESSGMAAQLPRARLSRGWRRQPARGRAVQRHHRAPAGRTAPAASSWRSLSLLHRITRAIGERQDLPSIFQVVLRSTRGAACRWTSAASASYEAEHERLRVDLHRRAQPADWRSRWRCRNSRTSPIDANGLSRCVQWPAGVRSGPRRRAVPVRAGPRGRRPAPRWWPRRCRWKARCSAC